MASKSLPDKTYLRDAIALPPRQAAVGLMVGHRHGPSMLSRGCHWLLDEIASWQFDPRVRDARMLQQIQFWKLTVNPDQSAVLVCDCDDVVVTQESPFTDFLLESVTLYCGIRGWAGSGCIELCRGMDGRLSQREPCMICIDQAVFCKKKFDALRAQEGKD